MIRAGQFRHTLVFQTKTYASDGLGPGGTETWSDTITIQAEKWSVSGSERVEAARNKQNSIYRWHCRYHAGIKPSMRVKWKNNNETHYQEVIAVNPLGNRCTELEILAEEKV